MQKLIIKGNKELTGIINISGSKNATLPILAASILANNIRLTNVPFVKDKVKLLEIHIEKGCPIANIPLKDLTKKVPEFKAYVF